MKYNLNRFMFAVAVISAPSIETFKAANSKADFYALGKPSMLKIHGTAQSVNGTLNKKGDVYTGTFAMPMDSFESGMKLRDRHMKEKVFEVEKYSASEFTLKPTSIPSGTKTTFTGILKFHGIEKPVQGDATVTIKDKKVEFNATFNVQLTDFSIQPPEFAGMSINNEVKVEISGEAQQ